MYTPTIYSPPEEHTNTSKTVIRKILIEVLNSPLLESFTDELFENLYNRTDKLGFIESILGNFPTDKLGTFHSKTVSNRNTKKRRWVESCLKEFNEKKTTRPKELYKEYLSLKGLFEINNDALLESSYGHTSLESAIEHKMKLLHNFSNNPDVSLIDYPYFKTKTENQKKSAIELEIKYVLVTTIVNRYNGKYFTFDAIIERPVSIIRNPSFGIRRDSAKVIKTAESITIEDESYLPAVLAPSSSLNEAKIDVYFNTNAGNTGLSSTNVFLFDTFDEQIFTYVISKCNYLAPKSRFIVDIGAMAYAIYKDTSQKNYTTIENRLHNMALIKFHKKDEKESYTFGLLDNVRIRKDSKWTASILLNDAVVEDIIANRTIAMYSDVISSFESEVSKILIYALQYDRAELFSQTNANVVTRKVYDYTFFSHKIRFNSKKRKENFNLILVALDEMISKKVVVLAYNLISDYKVEIIYAPFSNYELHDLVKDYTPQISNKSSNIL